jgi:amidase
VGLPALVLPAGPGRAGLPTAVQLVGPPGAETRLLWLAGELERLLPWRRYAPLLDPRTGSG